MLLLSEYTDGRDAARARAYFAQKRRKILLHTERAQFYNRSSIKGVHVRRSRGVWIGDWPSAASRAQALRRSTRPSPLLPYP